MKHIVNYYNEEKFRDRPETVKNLLRQEFDFLDTLDLYPILQLTRLKEIPISELMCFMEEIYRGYYEQYIEKVDGIETEYIFSIIDEDDFVDYLKQQYKLGISNLSDNFITYGE